MSGIVGRLLSPNLPCWLGMAWTVAIAGCHGRKVGIRPDGATENNNRPDSSVMPFCGDGVRDPNEDCDGLDLGGETCVSLGYGSGTVACAFSCEFDTSGCSICGNGVVEAGEECDDANAVDWDGCTECLVSEFQINTYTDAAQTHPDVAAMPDGGFVVVWRSWGQFSDTRDVVGRQFDHNGILLGDEFQVNTDAPVVGSPHVSASTNGDFVVVWTATDQGILARLFDASCIPSGPVFHANSSTNGHLTSPSVGMAPNGSFMVVWDGTEGDGDGKGVLGRTFALSAVPLSVEFQVNAYTLDDQGSPVVSAFQDGDFVVVWTSWGQDGMREGVFGRKFDSSGTALEPEFQVNYETNWGQFANAISAASDGGFIAIWEAPDGDGHGVFGQRFGPSGDRVGIEFQVNVDTVETQGNASVANTADGGFVVVWTSLGLFGRVFDHSGHPAGPDFQLHTYPASVWQDNARVALLADGTFVAVWHNDGQDGDNMGIMGQRFTPDGQPLGRLAW